MAKQTVNRLLGLEIDEVSLVDRPANQHGVVAFTKRDTTGGHMGTGLYDAQGNEFDESELEPGMTVLDGDGELRVLLDQDTAEALADEGIDLEDTDSILDALDFDSEDQLETVGKGRGSDLIGRAQGATGRGLLRMGNYGARGQAAITGGASSLKQTGRRVKDQALTLRDEVRTNPRTGKYAAVAGGGAAGGFVSGRASKSLGHDVLADLSKAYTDGERDDVLGRAFEGVEYQLSKADARATRAEQIAKSLLDREELMEFGEIAKGYELPVDPMDLAPILQTIAKSGLNEAQLDLVDRLFHAAGEAIYAEQGFSGSNQSGVMELIGGEALELVGKADGDFTPEQAAVAIMAAQPGAYEDYLYEMQGR